jgi:hypothetical protein
VWLRGGVGQQPFGAGALAIRNPDGREDEYLPNSAPLRAPPAQKKLIQACRLFLQTAPKYAQMRKTTNDTKVVPSDRIYPFAQSHLGNREWRRGNED